MWGPKSGQRPASGDAPPAVSRRSGNLNVSRPSVNASAALAARAAQSINRSAKKGMIPSCQRSNLSSQISGRCHIFLQSRITRLVQVVVVQDPFLFISITCLARDTFRNNYCLGNISDSQARPHGKAIERERASDWFQRQAESGQRQYPLTIPLGSREAATCSAMKE